MPLEELKFAGLASLDADEQIHLDEALDATNCYIDDLAIRGRNGYRAVTATPIGSGQVQGIWRFRPTQTVARTVVVRGGSIYLVTDPSSETASDGVSTLLASPFGTTANISGAQLGKDFYLCSDESASIWRRINYDLSLSTITTLPTPVAPTNSAGSGLSIVLFNSLAAPTLTGGLTSTASGITGWTNLAGTIGGQATYSLGTTYDWAATKWLFVACSPETISGGGDQFRIEIGNSSGNYAAIATVYDNPGTNGSPYVIFCSLVGVDSTISSAVTTIRFTQLGPDTDPFSVYGFMALPTAPSTGGTIPYYTTYYDSVAGEESVLSPANNVVYNSNGIVWPKMQGAHWNYNSFVNLGAGISTNPDSFSASACFNKSGHLSIPESSQFSLIQTFGGTVPAAAQPPYADTVRLWRQTDSGLRLVLCSVNATRSDGSAWTTGTGTSSDLPTGASCWSGSTWSITDNLGDAASANILYKAGGTPPPGIALAAVDGRLCVGGDPSNPQRETISSYTPFAKTTDPLPEFPAISLIPADGWQFDIAPTSSEQILWHGCGDNALYTLTNEAAYVMASIDPNSPPFQIFVRGVMGRRGGIWAESALYWCAHDGVYMAQNRSSLQELSNTIRRLFRSWFQPDSTVVMGYQDRKLYIVRGTYMLRFDFVKGSWTRHTLANTMAHCACWRDPAGIYQQMWFLATDGNIYRWQPGLSPTDTNRASSDNGATIAPWTYSTGFTFKTLYSLGVGYSDSSTRMRSIYSDTAGDTVTVSVYKDDTTSPVRSKVFASGEHQLPFANDLTAYKFRIAIAANSNASAVRRLFFEREVVAKDGA